MAYFAKLGVGNVVSQVESVVDDVILVDGVENEQKGIDYLRALHKNNDVYIQTSYNGSFRKNYAGIGHMYDQGRDAFIAPKPFNSWILDEETCIWDSPIPYPDDGEHYSWNEYTGAWDK